MFWMALNRPLKFLSTLSLRRATKAVHDLIGGFDISIHALLAESDLRAGYGRYSSQISIHALLAESDLVQIIMSGYARISIHALLAESDLIFFLRGVSLI